ncbi:MAG: HAD-IA family hydrolase [Actinobacteria bacterium]|nr:HAD-IA family hydrolase [Actinomycetota bacterium]
MENRIRCVLFDLDGTIIDSIPLIRTSFRYAAKKVLGRELPDEVLLANVGKPLEQQMKIICPEKADELVRAYREHNHLYHDSMVKPIEGIKDILVWLKSIDVSIGVVTSKTSQLAWRGLQVCGLEKYISALVAAENVVKHKPHSEPVLKCIEMLNQKTENSVFVGDSPYDIESGKNAGVLTIAVPFGPFSISQLKEKNPDYLVRSVDELYSLLKELV